MERNTYVVLLGLMKLEVVALHPESRSAVIDQPSYFPLAH